MMIMVIIMVIMMMLTFISIIKNVWNCYITNKNGDYNDGNHYDSDNVIE